MIVKRLWKQWIFLIKYWSNKSDSSYLNPVQFACPIVLFFCSIPFPVLVHQNCMDRVQMLNEILNYKADKVNSSIFVIVNKFRRDQLKVCNFQS